MPRLLARVPSFPSLGTSRSLGRLSGSLPSCSLSAILRLRLLVTFFFFTLLFFYYTLLYFYLTSFPFLLPRSLLPLGPVARSRLLTRSPGPSPLDSVRPAAGHPGPVVPPASRVPPRRVGLSLGRPASTPGSSALERAVLPWRRDRPRTCSTVAVSGRRHAASVGRSASLPGSFLQQASWAQEPQN